MTPSLQLSGVGMFMNRLARALHERGHEILVYSEVVHDAAPNVVAKLGPVKWTGNPATRKGLRRVFSQLQKGMKLLGSKENVFRQIELAQLRRLHEKHGFDVVNTHLIWAELHACEAFYETPIPIIASDHGDYRLPLASELAASTRHRQLLQRTDAVVCPCADNLQRASRLPRKAGCVQRVIHYGIDAEPHFQSGDRGLGRPFVFGMVSRGIEEKGWMEALQAFEIVHAKFPGDVRLAFVGGGRYMQELATRVPVHLRDSIVFSGHQENPGSEICRFDAGLLPSYYPSESLPNAAIEYLSWGKPVIATQWAGLPEILAAGDENAGILVPLAPNGRADVEHLAAAMLKYLESDGPYTQHARLAHQAFQKFSMNLCLDNYVGFFREVAEKFVGRRAG